MEISGDGMNLYVAAFGANRIGVVPIANLDSNWAGFDPTTASYIGVSGGGPSSLVLDEQLSCQRTYVPTRFDNAIAVIDLTSSLETDPIAMPTPEPLAVVNGRPFLYDASSTSSNGETSCASCHTYNPSAGFFGTGGNASFAGEPRIDAIQLAADTFFHSEVLGGLTKECELIAKGTVAGCTPFAASSETADPASPSPR